MSNVALADLTAARRRRRVADADWFELLYRVYLTVVGCGLGVLVIASFIGDEKVSASSLQRAAADGPAFVGIACAVVLLIGARSGARGGPLALEAPFVQHVLLSPIDRDHAMRTPARRLLMQAVLAGGLAGALMGLVAGERLPTSTATLVAGGAAAGATTAVAAIGLAMIVAGLRVDMKVVDALALPLGAATAIDVARGTAYSPTTWLGQLALDGVRADAVPSVAAVAFGGALAGLGLYLVGRTSLEAAQRRAGLVSSLALAVTRQDLRTVVLLQRRLAQDRARVTPWAPFVPPGRWAVWRRGWHGLLRLPARRLARMAMLGTVSAAACWAVWEGTVALIVVAGVALHAVALDAIEPLAQELDHPTRWGSYPVPSGPLLLQHLAAPAVLLAVAALPVVIGVAVVFGGEAGTVVALTAVCGCVGAVVGAAASVATPPFQVGAAAAMPEAMGMQLVFRVVWPVAVTTISLTPLLAARAALNRGEPPSSGALSLMGVVAIVAIAAGTWLRTRRPMAL